MTNIRMSNFKIFMEKLGSKVEICWKNDICDHIFLNNFEIECRGVVVDLSGLRDRGPGFKTRSGPLTFMKADTNFRTLHVVGFSCTQSRSEGLEGS
jgi:hypothetical protein